MSVTLTYGSLNLTAAPYGLQFGADLGAPQNVTEALAFLLQDGEIELTNRTSNRTITFGIIIEGANLLALAQAEQALMLEVNKPMNTLEIDPGDSGPATVYETFRGQVVWNRNDEHDMQRIRLYTLTIRAMPAGRSDAEVVTSALAASGSTTTLVDAGSATTGWSSTSGTVSVVSGAVSVTTTAQTGLVNVNLTRAGSITTSSTKYLQVDWKNSSAGTTNSLTATGDGVTLTRISEGPSPTAGYTRTHFYVAASSITTLVLNLATFNPKASLTRNLSVDNINRTDIRPTIGTARQQLRALPVSGSARTQGRLAVEHASSALGDVIVYTFPDSGNGYSPSLRQYRTAGGTVTTDANRVSGASEPITAAAFQAQIPNTTLEPGTYTLVARMLAGTAGVASATVTTRLYYTATGSVGSTVVSASPTPTLSTSYTNVVLGRFTLPPSDPPTSGLTLFQIQCTGASASTVTLDELWLFGNFGQLTMVSCGTAAPSAGGSSNRLWIDSPTVDSPRPAVSVGNAADRSDAFTTPITAWQTPIFEPPGIAVYTATSNALDASVSLAHYPRWELNAAS